MMQNAEKKRKKSLIGFRCLLAGWFLVFAGWRLFLLSSMIAAVGSTSALRLRSLLILITWDPRSLESRDVYDN